MKTAKYIYIVSLMLTMIVGCNKDDAPEGNSRQVPVLNSISPESGIKNSTVTILGSNFGTNASKVSVFFNEVEAVVNSVTETEIKTEVPSLSLTGKIKVVINDEELIGPDFNYEFSEAHVTTLAGNKDEGGYADGQGSEALFVGFGGITMDSDGNILACQLSNSKIREITPEGVVTTFSGLEDGYLDGHISEAQFSWVKDISIDASGNLYVADSGNNKIRKITPEGIVSTLAGSRQGYVDGQGSEAKFFLPNTITVDSSGNVYVAEGSASNTSSRIRKITPEGLVTTFAGGEKGFIDGQGTDARFIYIRDLAVDGLDNIIVADSGNSKIRKISPSGEVTTIAGSTEGYSDGKGDEAQFNNPRGLAVDKLNNIYVADYSNMRIRKIDPDGIVSTLAGSGSYGFTDGEGLHASIAFPRTLIMDNDFNLFFTQNNLVRKISME